jgi:choline kinase
MSEQAVILAAGRGERLVNGKGIPKPLVSVRGLPLIVRVIRGLERAGVERVAIVTGYLADVLREGVSAHHFDCEIDFVHNPDFHKPNGSSLLCAADFVKGPTWLVMSDHLCSPDLLHAVRRSPVEPDEVVLGVDFRVATCFDIDDATKVALRGDRIVGISKELPRYDAIDTGVFRITPAVIDALRRVDGPDGCSLSQGMEELASKGRLRAVDVEGAMWIDVDTPEAHEQAERLLRRYGASLRRRGALQPAVAAQ